MKKIAKKLVVVSLISFVVVSALYAADITKSYGLFKVEMHPKQGTFSLFLNDGESKKDTPIISTVDNSSRTLAYVQFGTKVYPLVPRSGVKVAQFLEDERAGCIYTVENKFSLEFTMKFYSSVSNVPADILEFNYSLKNLSSSVSNLALKLVFDTCMGETSNKHFSTAAKFNVSEEAILQTMDSECYVRSSDGEKAIQFLFNGADITPPEQVVLANKNVALSSTWMPNFRNGRGFNSIFSYNDSVIVIYYGRSMLIADESANYRFYGTAGIKEILPVDVTHEFFKNKVAAAAAAAAEETAESSEPDAEIEVFQTGSASTVVSIRNDDSDIAVGFELTPEQLDPAYIERLMKRIDELDKNPELADAEEIKKLHSELDLILNYLKE